MRRRTRHFLLALIALLTLAGSAAGSGDDVILTDPAYPVMKAYALDQPELYTLLADGGQIITDNGEPVLLEMFVDTGASGVVISNLYATGAEGVASLGFQQSDYIGTFTETGIAGQETGYVTRGFDVLVSNVTPGTVSEIFLDQFVDYGPHNLWVRQAPGPGEIIDFGGLPIVDPINIVGMPVISQRVMVLDPTPLAALDRMRTYLLPAGDTSIPIANISIPLELEDLTGQATPPEVLASHYDNPMIPNITIASGQTAIAGNRWLLDTGSSGSFISFAKAQAAGLIGSNYQDLGEFMATYDGPISQVGGIGQASITVPILNLDEIRIGSKEGFDVVWQDVDIMVADVAGLDGIFGMNLLLPSVTIDARVLEGQIDPDDMDAFLASGLAAILGLLSDQSPGYFESIVIDVSRTGDAELRLYSSLAPPPIPLGDANRDRKIDLVDLSRLATYWGLTGPTSWEKADFNYDGKVDLVDLGYLATNWGLDQTGAATPEPAALALLSAGGIVLVWRRRGV